MRNQFTQSGWLISRHWSNTEGSGLFPNLGAVTFPLAKFVFSVELAIEDMFWKLIKIFNNQLERVKEVYKEERSLFHGGPSRVCSHPSETGAFFSRTTWQPSMSTSP